MKNENAQKFLCNCKKMECWIYEGKITPACPACGRKYEGVYNRKKLSIEAKEVKNDRKTRIVLS